MCAPLSVTTVNGGDGGCEGGSSGSGESGASTRKEQESDETRAMSMMICSRSCHHQRDHRAGGSLLLCQLSLERERVANDQCLPSRIPNLHVAILFGGKQHWHWTSPKN